MSPTASMASTSKICSPFANQSNIIVSVSYKSVNVSYMLLHYQYVVFEEVWKKHGPTHVETNTWHTNEHRILNLLYTEKLCTMRLIFQYDA